MDDCWNCHGHGCFICDEEQEIVYDTLEQIQEDEALQEMLES